MKDVVELIFHPLPSMERLYLELTNRCNLGCTMCYRQSWHEAEGEMSREILTKISAEVSAFPDLREVIFGGIGEPTIADNFRKAVELFSFRYELTITTNGTTLDNDLIDFLLSHKVNRVILSIDSADVETFDTIRHHNVNRILENTRSLAAKRVNGKPEIIWEFLAMKKTIPHLVETVRRAHEHGVNKILVSHILPLTPEMIEETLYHPVSPDTVEVFMHALRVGLSNGIPVVLPKSEIKTDRYCKFVETQSAVVRWDGEVFPCYRFMHSYPEYVQGRHKEIKAHSFGSVCQQELLQLWTSPKFMQYRYKVLNSDYPSCTDCELVQGCDMVASAEMDCLGNDPSCGDCLWGRGITFCP